MAPSATLTPARLATAVRRRPLLRIALGTLAVILGLGGIVLGGLLFATAHNTHPVEVDGSIADYQAITINGAYAHNDLRLADDAHTYTFDSRQFHPSLPERFQKDARIQIWVDQGTTNVLAVTLYDEMGLNPTAYTTSEYDNPTLAYYSALGQAGVLAGIGVVLLLGGAVAALGRSKRWRLAQRQEREREQERERGARQDVPRGAVRARPGAGQRVPAVALPASAASLASPGPGGQALPPLAPFGPPAAAPGALPSILPGAIPLAQAMPTTPMPGRQPAPPRPASPAASIDEIPTKKAPALPPAGAPAGAPAMPPAAPPQPGIPAISGGADQWGAWGVPPQPASPPPVYPPSPPGSLPDFPTERMPSAAPTPPPVENLPGDVGDQPTRKSETASPPDPSRGG